MGKDYSAGFPQGGIAIASNRQQYLVLQIEIFQLIENPLCQLAPINPFL